MTSVAFLAVPGDGNPTALEGLSVRIWPAGDAIPKRVTRLVPSDAGVAAVIIEARATEPHWLAVEPARGDATVVALPLLPHRLATVIAQVDADRARAYQLHPLAGAHESSTPEQLISVEYLERQLLSGRIDGAEALAKKLAEAAGRRPGGRTTPSSRSGSSPGTGSAAPGADLVASVIRPAPSGRAPTGSMPRHACAAESGLRPGN